MRPISHPAMADVTVESILHALSDPVRVRIFGEIARADCTKICSEFLSHDNKTLAKSTLSQHFKILREAGLIRSERRGVELHNITRCAELEKRFGSMIAQIVAAYGEQSRKKKTKKQ